MMKWMLNPKIFEKISKRYFVPDIDLFASRLNNQIPNYIAWKHDPGAMYIDAFTCNWFDKQFYAFPSFSIIGKVVQKICTEKATSLSPGRSWSFSKAPG